MSIAHRFDWLVSNNRLPGLGSSPKAVPPSLSRAFSISYEWPGNCNALHRQDSKNVIVNFRNLSFDPGVQCAEGASLLSGNDSQIGWWT